MNARGQIRGWHVLLAIVMFFTTVIAVNAAFIVYAVRTFPGEDVPKSYLQGLHYNETLKERREQAALGWRATAAAKRGMGGESVIEVRLRDVRDAPIEGAALTGVLRRPTQAKLDHTLAFTAMGGGLYRARVAGLEPGLWDLAARADRGAARFDLHMRLVWTPPAQF